MSDHDRLNILTYSTLFPNEHQGRHGIFVETRLRHLCQDYPVTADVMAPVPWFPSANPRYGRYATYARVADTSQRGAFAVSHPRYVVIPKVGWLAAPWFQYLGARRRLRALHARNPYQLIDAHFYFPDGIAATLLARHLDLPVMITARGSDLTVMAEHPLVRRMVLWAADTADALVTVSAALGERLVELGAPREKITVLRNGVDLERFYPVSERNIRAELTLRTPRLIISVGNLIELKGHHLTIEALTTLTDATLVLIGDGPERAALSALAERLGVADRVIFLGLVEQSELPHYYSAADAMVLASRSEGWANVLLESMACGCPAVASRVWGTPEVVAEPAAGRLMRERTPQALAAAVRELLEAGVDRAATRRYAERFSWHDTSAGQFEIMQRIARPSA